MFKIQRLPHLYIFFIRYVDLADVDFDDMMGKDVGNGDECYDVGSFDKDGDDYDDVGYDDDRNSEAGNSYDDYDNGGVGDADIASCFYIDFSYC